MPTLKVTVKTRDLLDGTTSTWDIPLVGSAPPCEILDKITAILWDGNTDIPVEELNVTPTSSLCTLHDALLIRFKAYRKYFKDAHSWRDIHYHLYSGGRECFEGSLGGAKDLF